MSAMDPSPMIQHLDELGHKAVEKVDALVGGVFQKLVDFLDGVTEKVRDSGTRNIVAAMGNSGMFTPSSDDRTSPDTPSVTQRKEIELARGQQVEKSTPDISPMAQQDLGRITASLQQNGVAQSGGNITSPEQAYQSPVMKSQNLTKSQGLGLA